MEGNAMNKLIRELGAKVLEKKLTWKQASELINKEIGTKLSPENLRNKYLRLPKEEEIIKENFILYGDGTIEAEAIVNLSREEKKSPETVLAYMGYGIDAWRLDKLEISTWQQHTKEQTTKALYACKAKLIPINKTELTAEECIEVANKLFEKGIEPFKFKPTPKIKGLDDDLLMEIPGIELHLGKMAWSGDTGQNYDKNIATERFYDIMNAAMDEQERRQCGTLLYLIGNDFFNSDTIDSTTTKGTPQTNDLRWRKLFEIGLELHCKMFDSMVDKFNTIEVKLDSGNHDKMASFYLYQALKQRYRDCDKIHFTDNYKDVQCFPFGQCAIFFTHGDTRGKGGFDRLIKSIPAEFYKEWGASIFRELHLGHLHKEFVVDDESGLVIRRTGSPTGTDQYHYEERYIGATQKQQIFIWDKEVGLIDNGILNFSPREDVQIKSKRRK